MADPRLGGRVEDRVAFMVIETRKDDYYGVCSCGCDVWETIGETRMCRFIGSDSFTPVHRRYVRCQSCLGDHPSMRLG